MAMVVLALFLVGVASASAQEEPPPVHQAITEYSGPETCANCHISSAQEVVDSLHYQHQGQVPYREGWEDNVLGGMYVTF